MKFVWEDNDIVMGTKYSKPDIKEVWMFGYIPDVPNQICSISMMDGLVVNHGQNRQNLAERLTKENYIPLKYLEK